MWSPNWPLPIAGERLRRQTHRPPTMGRIGMEDRASRKEERSSSGNQLANSLPSSSTSAGTHDQEQPTADAGCRTIFDVAGEFVVRVRPRSLDDSLLSGNWRGRVTGRRGPTC